MVVSDVAVFVLKRDVKLRPIDRHMAVKTLSLPSCGIASEIAVSIKQLTVSVNELFVSVLFGKKNKSVFQMSQFYALRCSRHHPNYDDCLEDNRENCQNCSELCCILYDSCAQ